jgi:hypothetical protein
MHEMMMMVTNEILHVMLECEKEFYDQRARLRIVKSLKQQEKRLISPSSI